MGDAIEHAGDREEPGREECGAPRCPKSPHRGYPDSEPRQVEEEKDEEWYAWQAEQSPQSLVKAGGRFLNKVNALNPDRNGECTRGSGSLSMVGWGRESAPGEQQSGERR